MTICECCLIRRYRAIIWEKTGLLSTDFFILSSIFKFYSLFPQIKTKKRNRLIVSKQTARQKAFSIIKEVKSMNSNSKQMLQALKTEAANSVNVNLKQGYNGDLTSKQAGSIGGEMVKRMIAYAEQNMK